MDRSEIHTSAFGLPVAKPSRLRTVSSSHFFRRPLTCLRCILRWIEIRDVSFVRFVRALEAGDIRDGVLVLLRFLPPSPEQLLQDVLPGKRDALRTCSDVRSPARGRGSCGEGTELDRAHLDSAEMGESGHAHLEMDGKSTLEGCEVVVLQPGGGEGSAFIQDSNTSVESSPQNLSCTGWSRVSWNGRKEGSGGRKEKI